MAIVAFIMKRNIGFSNLFSGVVVVFNKQLNPNCKS